MKGNIFNIQRFSINDGPGIRTTVFLKGCPLSCAWCHNPESNSPLPDIFYDPVKCAGCGKCEKICKNAQHVFDSGEHIFLRSSCTLCMDCVSACPAGAFEICGKEITPEDILSEVLRDKEFYEESGGGVTLSGGEPLMQYDFAAEILKKSKEYGIHTAVETSGYCKKDLSEIRKFVDLWLYDIKLFPENKHIEYTGVSNKIILDNLYFLDNAGAKIILRCPIIPDINLNKDHFNEIAKLAESLKNIEAVHFEPYHPLGTSKAEKLGRIQRYDKKELLSGDEILPFAAIVKDKTNVKIEIL